ncbi:MAG: hypothetical protein QNJ97_21650 [Myxococcota bacterium]|nr:hypothetical protein [Myxococcota bacterium]
MDRSRKRDIFLIALFGVIVLLLLLPKGKDTESGESPGDAQEDADVHSSALGSEGAEQGLNTSNTPQKHERSSEPLVSAFHRFFPLVPGTRWVYRVHGDRRFVPSETWTLKIVAGPAEDTPCTAEVGFGEEKKTAHIWRDSGSIRFGQFPHTEPVDFLGNLPSEIQGEFLPAEMRIGQGAVWSQFLKRDVIYQYRDKKGNQRSEPALAKQRDRAHVENREMIATPAGQYDAWRISWISRIDITAKGRPVLQELTSAPYRKETMWIAEGIGVVRRRIEYTGYPKATVTFDLTDFDHPTL